MENKADIAWHAESSDVVLQRMESQSLGLTRDESVQRRERYGPNTLRRSEHISPWHVLLDQLTSVVIFLLVIAAGLAFVFGQSTEGVAILSVVVVNTLIGFVSEWRAQKSMEALRRMGQVGAKVRRDGREQSIDAEELVPGDVLLLQRGAVISADARLLKADGLLVSEAALTGESVPVRKSTQIVDLTAALAERLNMIYRGTTVEEGEGEAVVVATGMETELGRIATLASQAGGASTPLEQQLDWLGRRLAWIVILIAVVVGLAGLAAGQPMLLMIETAIALGVAAIPEGLPVVATIALARGMWQMARRKAVINRLSAVETLGSTSVIFTDKTGTLTENRMVVKCYMTAVGVVEMDTLSIESSTLLRQLLETGVLCSNAELAGDDGVKQTHGDPTEVALLEVAARFGIQRSQLLTQQPEVREHTFDPKQMMMATAHRDGDSLRITVKGAPRSVIEACERISTESGSEPLDKRGRKYWLERNRELASSGLRVLALADKHSSNHDEPYQGLTFLGLVGLYDPPRSGVRESISACRSAGIEVVMLTGDQPDTARAIAEMVGITDKHGENVIHGADLGDLQELDNGSLRELISCRIFARISPEQKLRIAELFQREGKTVAMTGDGVNDTPALKQADIGIAMGLRGTDAARQVSDMILKDDAFSTIVAAVRQGRVIFGNIRKSVMFMLVTNVAEILAVTAASLSGAPLPLLPLQILYLNLVTDIFPALALGVGQGHGGVMERPPRAQSEAVITAEHWRFIARWSAIEASAVLSVLAWGLIMQGYEQSHAVTLSFLTLGFSKLWFVLNLRDPKTTLLDNDIINNIWMRAAIALCTLLLLAAIYLPGLDNVLGTRQPYMEDWIVVIIFSAAPAAIGQLVRAWSNK